MATNGKGAKTAGIAGLAAAAAGAAAAGYYFYASKDAGKHRKIAAKWAGGLKADVLKKAKKLDKLDKKQLEMVIREAAAAYETVRGIDKEDLTKAANELKGNWEAVAKELQKGAKKATKKAVVASKSAKKAVKKVVAKAKKAK